MMSRRVASCALLLCGVLLAGAGCERESRPFQQLPAASARTERPLLSQNTPGGRVGESPIDTGASPFQENAWGISEGKRLFEQYNCVGCHAHGGGGMGPALIDDRWIYGNRAANLFDTIVQGRPNGMPAFRNKIPDSQIWQLVAYIQSMGGHAPLAALPGRSDHMRVGTPENARPATPAVQTGHP